MTRWQLWTLGLGAGLVVAGSAAAALGMAKWDYYRTDLIRCADAEVFGVPACGSDNLGDDRLKQGVVTINGRRLTVHLTRAEPNAFYFVDFVPLRNVGIDPDSAYAAEGRLFFGGVATNGAGNGTMRTENFSLIGPQLGYFVLSSPQEEFVIDAMSLDEAGEIHAQQFENEDREFVSGFDPEFVIFPGPPGPVNS
ncbi:hypothetical protein HY375_00995 [Candidatus Berkelbacteria bacterium]|nr:hypothetical protein [Candidatus Berkelbacteria bacterium]